MAKSKYSGMDDADVNNGGVYFTPGDYKVEVVKVFDIESRKRDDLFIVECVVLEASGEGTKRPGSKPSWVVNLKHDSALGNIKGFLIACLDCEPEEVGVNEVEEAVGEDNPMAGSILNLTVEQITTKAGHPFNVHRWSPASN